MAEVQTRTEAAVSSYYADRSSYREGYSDACDTLCELVQHMAQTRCDYCHRRSRFDVCGVEGCEVCP